MLTASGQLKHHFWGDYAASIVLQFDSPTAAQVALPHFQGWRVHKTHADVLVFHGSDPALETALTQLEAHGANRDVVCSCAKSIDYGEHFVIEVKGCERALLEACGQQPLPMEAQ
jgi:hypothetical protein